MEIRERSLIYTVDNVKKIIESLMAAAMTSESMRAILASEPTAKLEIEKYLIARPPNWDKVQVSFDQLELGDAETVDRFHGLFAGGEKFEVSAALGSRCCIRCPIPL